MIKSSTARFEDRALSLKACFTQGSMEKVWKKYVWPGLRNQSVLDLHDYYDFHKNTKVKCQIIIKQIMDGSYRPKPPIIVRLEKKHGIARHLPIPAPEDAVVFQTLTEFLLPHVAKAQPSKKSFYTRSHGFVGEESIDESFPYPWWELWPEFQKRIYGFAHKFPFVVVTDIANYYDSISFEKLRNTLTGIGRFDEPLIDFLFYLLESFLWRPDYIPLTGIGLPQLNFDAPRLLAHSFLFDVDKFLEEKTKSNFVRWMDDIDFGVNSIHEAKDALKELDEILLAKGLRLNMGKTKILSSAQARDYFLPDENRWLSIMEKRVLNLKALKRPYNNEAFLTKRRFKKFLKKAQVGRWSKVYCRYFTLFQHLENSYLERHIPDLLDHNPDTREHICRYYSRLGYSSKRFEHLSKFYEGQHCNDESTLFTIVKVLIGWSIRPKSKVRKQIVDLAIRGLDASKARFVAGLWLLAKYGITTDLCDAIKNNTNKWKHSNFVARQIASILPRIRNAGAEYDLIRQNLYESGQLDALSIIFHFDTLRLNIPSSLGEMLYLKHGVAPSPLFPLQKVIIAENILTNTANSLVQRQTFRDAMLSRVDDPIYREIILASV